MHVHKIDVYSLQCCECSRHNLGCEINSCLGATGTPKKCFGEYFCLPYRRPIWRPRLASSTGMHCGVILMYNIILPRGSVVHMSKQNDSRELWLIKAFVYNDYSARWVSTNWRDWRRCYRSQRESCHQKAVLQSRLGSGPVVVTVRLRARVNVLCMVPRSRQKSWKKSICKELCFYDDRKHKVTWDIMTAQKLSQPILHAKGQINSASTYEHGKRTAR